ncbi:MAG: type II secretion system protein [Phycisphaeraceae bacterium]
MKTNLRKNRGFTLIELMIIVTIIGILAAIVIPTFSNANETAKAGALASQLNTVKKSLVLYSTDHNGVFPTDAQLITNQWQVLTNTTDINGDVSGEDYGPYFQKPPFNAFMDSSVVAADNSAAWQYTSSTGTIKAVVPSAVVSSANDLQLSPSDLIAAP